MKPDWRIKNFFAKDIVIAEVASIPKYYKSLKKYKYLGNSYAGNGKKKEFIYIRSDKNTFYDYNQNFFAPIRNGSIPYMHYNDGNVEDISKEQFYKEIKELNICNCEIDHGNKVTKGKEYHIFDFIPGVVIDENSKLGNKTSVIVTPDTIAISRTDYIEITKKYKREKFYQKGCMACGKGIDEYDKMENYVNTITAHFEDSFDREYKKWQEKIDIEDKISKMCKKEKSKC